MQVVVERLRWFHRSVEDQGEPRPRSTRVSKVRGGEDEPHAPASRKMATAFRNGTPQRCMTRSTAPPPPLRARVS